MKLRIQMATRLNFKNGKDFASRMLAANFVVDLDGAYSLIRGKFINGQSLGEKPKGERNRLYFLVRMTIVSSIPRDTFV